MTATAPPVTAGRAQAARIMAARAATQARAVVGQAQVDQVAHKRGAGDRADLRGPVETADPAGQRALPVQADRPARRQAAMAA